ncbi:MAG: hypothetical protein APF81_11015 [Desulfosporosinus sp. BRH_c37]|nr:MAG: hypothetical protein APF81_11015 [Desulfosporosinus sp. BRH_c37]
MRSAHIFQADINIDSTVTVQDSYPDRFELKKSVRVIIIKYLISISIVNNGDGSKGSGTGHSAV